MRMKVNYDRKNSAAGRSCEEDINICLKVLLTLIPMIPKNTRLPEICTKDRAPLFLYAMKEMMLSAKHTIANSKIIVATASTNLYTTFYRSRVSLYYVVKHPSAVRIHSCPSKISYFRIKCFSSLRIKNIISTTLSHLF